MRKVFRTSGLWVFMAFMVATISLGGLFAAAEAAHGPSSIASVGENAIPSNAMHIDATGTVASTATVAPSDTDAIIQEIIRIIISIIESILTTPTVTPTSTAIVTPTSTAIVTPTSTAIVTPTSTAIVTPTATATTEPTATATTEPTATATSEPTEPTTVFAQVCASLQPDNPAPVHIVYSLTKVDTDAVIGSYNDYAQLPTCLDYQLEPGASYAIAIDATGYESVRRTVTVVAGGDNVFNNELTPSE